MAKKVRRPPDQKMTLSIWLEGRKVGQIERIAAKVGIAPSALARYWVEEALKRVEQKGHKKIREEFERRKAEAQAGLDRETDEWFAAHRELPEE